MQTHLYIFIHAFGEITFPAMISLSLSRSAVVSTDTDIFLPNTLALAKRLELRHRDRPEWINGIWSHLPRRGAWYKLYRVKEGRIML